MVKKTYGVIYRNINTDEYVKQGLEMKRMEDVEHYVLNEMKAIKFGDNKYKLPNEDLYVYIETYYCV